MEEFKRTKIQHYVDNDDVTNYVFCDENGNRLAATLETAERNTKIFNEAFSVVTRTGLTPEQMEKRISDLEQQSKEKDEMIKELEFANEEVRKKHDLARNLITDQDEEIKRLKQLKLEHELFIGKASESLGFDKTIELLKDAKDAFK